MKFNYITKGIIPALAVVLSLSSCLKDDNLDQDFESAEGKNFVGIFDSSPSSSSVNSTSFGVVSSAEESTITLRLRYMGEGVSPGVTVNLSIPTDSAAVVGPLNQARNTNYYTLDPENYELPQTSVTIPAGETEVTFPVVVKPNTITKTDVGYALPVVISNGGGVEISGNFGKHVVLVTIRNPYDGEYHSTGVFTHPASGPRDIDEDKTLTTINPTTVELNMADLVPETMRLQVDPATNLVTVIGALSSTGAALVPTPGKTSTYDPATRTFHVYYQYSGGGGFRVVEEHIVRLDD